MSIIWIGFQRLVFFIYVHNESMILLIKTLQYVFLTGYQDRSFIQVALFVLLFFHFFLYFPFSTLVLFGPEFLFHICLK